MATELNPTPNMAAGTQAATSTPAPASARVVAPKTRRSHPSLTRKNLIGLALTLLLGITNLPSLLEQPGPDVEGPPIGVLILDTICGVVMVIACVVVWRTGSRGAVRLVCGVNILQALSGFPAFFVDIPVGIKIAVAVATVLSFVAVVLMLSPERRAAPVTD